MPDLSKRSATNPEFARVISRADLGDACVVEFDISPTAEESEAIARLLGARSVRKMRFFGALRPIADGWGLTARLGATVVQTCVVSLDPVTTRVDDDMSRRFLATLKPDGPEVVLLPGDADDDVEPLGARIDLGAVALEALALALPAYPRKPDAALADTEPDAGQTRREKPFASLAALRERMRDGEG